MKETGAEYSIGVGINKDKLRADLNESKTMVKEAVREMTVTSNVAIGNPTDLGPTSAAGLREGNIASRMEKMRVQQERQREELMIRTAARNRLGITTATEQRELSRFKAQEAQERARDDAAFRQFIADRNARSIFTGSRDGPDMGDIERAGAFEARAGRKVAMADRIGSLRRDGMILGGVAGGAAVVARQAFESRLAESRAFRDAGERFAFSDRTAFNDRTIRAAAGTMGMAANAESNPLGKLLSVLPGFTDQLEKAGHAAGLLADSHRTAVSAIREQNINRANLMGMPLESLRLTQEQELKASRGELEKAIRNQKDIEFQGDTFWEKFTGRSSRRGGEARRVTREAQSAFDKLKANQELETELAGRREFARRQGIMVGAQMSELGTVEASANLRGDSVGALAARREQERKAMERQFEDRLAGTAREDERRVIENERRNARMTFGLESRLQLRQLGSNNTGMTTTTGEAAGFAAFNQMQFSTERANLDTALAQAIRELAAALQRTPLIGQN
ncbi:MAG TPA: hypothetical protein VD994_07495 [Prosthecobacter sp.]|nr:hypothetical protein [Prosthecobacter sp.]